MSRKRSPEERDLPRLQNTLRLSAEGLATVLGDLEARVLRSVWTLAQPVPARAVIEHVVTDHPVSPLTVITVLNKLVVKHVLARRKLAGRYHYSARMGEAEFMAHVSRRAVEGVLSLSPDAVAASMVDVLAERDPAHLAELAQLIQRRLHERDDGDSGASNGGGASPET